MVHTTIGIAAILTFVIGIVHSWLGEVRLIGPLVSPGQRVGMLASSAFSRHVLRFAWHLTTLAWWGFAAIMAWLALSPLEDQSRTVLLIIGVTFLITAIVTLITSRGRHLAWPVFLAIAGLCVVPLLNLSI
jgi:hypothetical protein